MDTKIGGYGVRLERLCWLNNITGHAIYTKSTRGREQENGTYFLDSRIVAEATSLTRKEVKTVRRFIARLLKSRPSA